MSDEKFKVVIAFLQTALFVSGVVVVLINWGKSWQKAAAEKSIGATKVRELEKEAKDVGDSIEELTRVSESNKKEIAEIQKSYKDLINHIWDLLGKK